MQDNDGGKGKNKKQFASGKKFFSFMSDYHGINREQMVGFHFIAVALAPVAACDSTKSI